MKTSIYTSRLFWMLLVSFVGLETSAQVQVDVNIDVNHQVGRETTFNRSKWINVHSSQSASVWNGDMDKFEYLVNDLDVSFGRETGHIKSSAKRVNQDPTRPGYADPNHMKILGDADKASYAKKTDRHAYEKGNFIVANQQLPLFPNGNNPTDGGWYYASTDTTLEPFGTASGEFCANYFNNYFGSGGIDGFPMPKYFEIMNEPVWHFVDRNHDGGGTLEKVFKFHKTVADIIHDKVPGLQVGGFGTAFPDFDEGGNLQEWEERWKFFIRDYGSAFDFYTIHLYDRPIQNGNEIEQYRKGGRNEATFDMMEHYSMLQYNKVKPFFITEYGGQLWGMSDRDRLWRPHNDWRRIEAFNAMLMQFLERPNVFVSAIPFVMPKAEWGYDAAKDIPYRCRLLRKANEPESYSGEWVWTEYIKFYELWSDVKGVRLDTHANHLDFQVDAYANGKEVYVILNNIESATIDFNLNIKGVNTNKIESIEVKRLYFTEDEQVMLTKNTYNSLEEVQQIRDDETLIAKYIFKDEVVVNKTSLEEKHYATTYKQSIVANTSVNFTFENINKGTNGEAVLRLGLARALSLHRFPTSIKVNGASIDIPDNYRGDLQRGRDQFFGMLEIKVPFDLISSGNNQVEVVFGETGGHISSSALQVFNFSREIKRTEDNEGMSTEEVELNQNLGVYPIPAEKNITITGDLKNWEIKSVEGKLLKEGTTKEISIESLEAGVYFITLNKTVTKKIIKI
ncbi:agarase [Wenyingzhuangia heitensis]|uniref:Agarase n=1 Tax=Wenyingzhuangia heitensis TaxID=1487859 RepID=A0ABX0UF85_9FLAO|nr:T9SS type A sorting domain-containing protein [Wenyingzhuangia heitensis]NIJ46206.1 agarase [Wenyingzhuangia heitensis]